jgi:hypothetical protein
LSNNHNSGKLSWASALIARAEGKTVSMLLLESPDILLSFQIPPILHIQSKQQLHHFPFLVAVSIAASRFHFSLPFCGAKYLCDIGTVDSRAL